MTVPVYNMTDTWNNGATVFTAIQMNVTNTASDPASLLMDLQVGSASQFRVMPGGSLVSCGTGTIKFRMTGSSVGGTNSGTGAVISLGYNAANNKQFWMGDFDGLGSASYAFIRFLTVSGKSYIDGVLGDSSAVTPITIGGGGGIILGNAGNSATSVTSTPSIVSLLDTVAGVPAQTFRVYNTYTDASNYERGVFDWTTTANVLTIGTQALGTGTLRPLVIVSSVFNVSQFGDVTATGGMAAFNNSTATNAIYTVNGGNHTGGWMGLNSGIQSHAAGYIGFSSTSDASASPDLAMTRSAAGVVAFGTSTSGDASACIKAKTKAGAPTTSDVPSGTWILIRDTTNNTTKVYYNNAGTLMTVSLV